MEICVFGTGIYGEALFKKCGKHNIDIRCVFDTNKRGMFYGFSIMGTEYLLEKVADLANVPFVLAMADVTTAFNIASWLYNNGVHNVFLFMNKAETYMEGFFEGECIRIGGFDGSVLPNVEMHVADYCNLNCKGCTHFSPLFEKELPDTNNRLKDVKKLSSMFDTILVFSLLGGEPFLNPDLKEYVRTVREEMNKTDIHIITNGILIPQIDQETLDVIREMDATIYISEYEPTHRIMDSVKRRLEDSHVKYGVRGNENKTSFNLPLSLSPNSKFNRLCISKNCTAVSDGRIARCPTLLYISKFNKRFGTALPEQGIYDLDGFSKGDASRLIELLAQDVKLCNHCIDNRIKWERCGSNPSLFDFAIEE